MKCVILFACSFLAAFSGLSSVVYAQPGNYYSYFVKRREEIAEKMDLQTQRLLLLWHSEKREFYEQFSEGNLTWEETWEKNMSEHKKQYVSGIVRRLNNAGFAVELKGGNSHRHLYTRVFVTFKPGFPPDYLRWEPETKAGNVWTVRIPLEDLSDLKGLDLENIIEISADLRVQPTLDLSIKDIKADSVHAGIDLPRPFLGKGTMVGIVDGGFDFTHPTFRRLPLNNPADIRFTDFWNQPDDSGPKPRNFNFGTETVGADKIFALKTDKTENQSHGSHVAGIAAGAGYPGSGKYIGVAPEAEIIAVRTNFTQAGIAAGVQYCFEKARSYGKPIAVNLSIGGRVGPRDGTSPLDRSFDNLVGIGQILVGAAGNSGPEKYHLFHQFTAPDTVQTVVQVSDFEGERSIAGLDIWSERLATFRGRMVYYDSLGNRVKELTDFISTARTLAYREDSVILDDGTKITFQYGVRSTVSNSINRKSQITMYALAPKNKKGSFVMEIIGENMHFHAWNITGIAEFRDELTSGIKLPGALVGDATHTITEVGGTAKRIITVGAYTTRRTFTNIEGKEREIYRIANAGEIAPFTGIGPTTDGRTKPDITAPGNMISSAMSSADKAGRDMGMDTYEYKEGESAWRFGMFHGTSMAAPHATGAVALLLEVAPFLNYETVHPLLTRTAARDSFTKVIPQEGVNNWGWGKLNVWEAVKEAVQRYVSVDEALTVPEKRKLVLYPNPSSEDNITLSAILFPAGGATVSVTDITGREILTRNVRIDSAFEEIDLRTESLSPGCYVVKLVSADGSAGLFSKLIRK